MNSIKKAIIVLLIISAAHIYAASGPNGASVHFSTGYNPTGMGLTNFMNRPFNANFTNNSIFGQSLYAPMADFENIERFDKADAQNKYSTGSAFSAGLKFNFLTFLFVKSEFTYDTNKYLPIKYNASFKSGNFWEPAKDTEVSYEFSYDSMAVPVVFGINIPVEIKNKYKADIFFGAGAVWTQTKYLFTIEAPFGYINDGTAIGRAGFREELEFNTMTYGYTWIAGADYQIYSNLNFFIEIDSYIYNSVVTKSKYTSDTMKTYTVEGPRAEMDLSHTLVKMGVSYKFSDLVKNFFF